MARKGRPGRETPSELSASQHRLRVTTLVLYAVALIAILVVAALEYQTHQALCSFRGDLEQRVVQTQDYLATHQANKIFGVPRATIVHDLNGRERVLRSLDGLHC